VHVGSDRIHIAGLGTPTASLGGFNRGIAGLGSGCLLVVPIEGLIVSALGCPYLIQGFGILYSDHHFASDGLASDWVDVQYVARVVIDVAVRRSRLGK
jgi:hypothetical protein